MAMLKLFVYLLVMLFFIVVGLLFSFRNQTLVHADLLLLQFPSLSLGHLVLSSLIIGVLLGILITYPKRIFKSIKIKHLSKKVSQENAVSSSVKSELGKGH